ncbi:MAG: LysR family transcriptional regulator, partial [Chloroflexi bacterium]|nr:LysR family transcriptional regulator [Chloroflexota bacterium]
MTPLPSLDALKAFEAAARLGSFSRAAAELHVTHGAISRHVANLERQLGVALFDRAHRRVALTPAGRILFEATHDGLATISSAVARLRPDAARRPFVVSCERSLAMKWIIPRLSEFQDENPGLRLHLSTGGGSVEFAGEYLDVAIRRADFPLNPAWHIENFMAERIGPVCHPKVAEAFKQGTFVALHTTSRPSAWSDWGGRTGHDFPQRQDQYFDHFFLCVEAAIAGLGVAVVPLAIAIDELETGRLVAPAGFVADGTKYCLIAETEINTDPRKATFLKWLQKKANELDYRVAHS